MCCLSSTSSTPRSCIVQSLAIGSPLATTINSLRLTSIVCLKAVQTYFVSLVAVSTLLLKVRTMSLLGILLATTTLLLLLPPLIALLTASTTSTKVLATSSRAQYMALTMISQFCRSRITTFSVYTTRPLAPTTPTTTATYVFLFVSILLRVGGAFVSCLIVLQIARSS